MKGIPLYFLIVAGSLFPALSRASDPCDGPNVTEDLKDLPPIYDQSQAEMCFTFTAKTLLDYNIHEACLAKGADICAYKPANMVSAMDLHSDSATIAEAERGKFVDFADMSGLTPVLEGAQKSGTVSDEDLPFDQGLFQTNASGEALVGRLSAYYEKLAEEKRLKAVPRCEDGATDFGKIEAQYPEIRKIALAACLPDDFLRDVGKKYFPIPDSVQGKRRAMLAGYDIDAFASAHADQFNEHLLSVLQNKQPIAIPLCINKLVKAANIDGGSSDPDPCGVHGMTVVGFRKDASDCKIHLRNTWGVNWPRPDGDGTVWVDAKVVDESIYHPNDSLLRTVSIAPRPPSRNVENTIESENFSFKGETWNQVQINGTETINSNGNKVVETGQFFPNGAFHSGTLKVSGKEVTGIFNNDGTNSFNCGYMIDPGGIWCVQNGGRSAKVLTSKSCSCP